MPAQNHDANPLKPLYGSGNEYWLTHLGSNVNRYHQFEGYCHHLQIRFLNLNVLKKQVAETKHLLAEYVHQLAWQLQLEAEMSRTAFFRYSDKNLVLTYGPKLLHRPILFELGLDGSVVRKKTLGKRFALPKS
ncbi:hypothetical protein D3C80_1117130 [compost metagenome]